MKYLSGKSRMELRIYIYKKKDSALEIKQEEKKFLIAMQPQGTLEKIVFN